MLTVNQREIDLGLLRFGKTYNFKYVITNEHDKPVIINKVRSGCSSCTKAECNRRILAPAESADINVEFTPGSTGIQVKQVSVAHMTQDHRVEPDLVLKFKAKVDE